MNVFDQLIERVTEAGARLGVEFEADAQEVRDYVKERAFHLARCVGEPGFEEAALAERDNVMLKLAMSAVAAGDAADAELRGILDGGLSVIAGLLSRGIA